MDLTITVQIDLSDRTLEYMTAICERLAGKTIGPSEEERALRPRESVGASDTSASTSEDKIIPVQEPAPIIAASAKSRSKRAPVERVSEPDRTPPARYEHEPGVQYTKERKAHLKVRWNSHDHVSVIMAELNSMPGLPITDTRKVGIMAAQLGAKRPKDYSFHRSRRDAMSVADRQIAQEIRDEATAPIDWRGAMDWAHRHGVKLDGTEEDDLRATNAKRREYELPPYRIVETPGGRGKLPDTRLVAT